MTVAVVLKCPRQANCAAAGTGQAERTAGGGRNTRCAKGYADPLCAVCEADYYRSHDRCHRCGDHGAWRYDMLGLLCLCIPIAWASWRMRGLYNTQRKPIVALEMAIADRGLNGQGVFSTDQTPSGDDDSSATPSGDWQDPHSSSTRHIDDNVAGRWMRYRSWWDMLSTPLRITVSFFQVLTQLNAVLHFRCVDDPR